MKASFRGGMETCCEPNILFLSFEINFFKGKNELLLWILKVIFILLNICFMAFFFVVVVGVRCANIFVVVVVLFRF
jgi:hypothetical protein